jgi:hypothetical protein
MGTSEETDEEVALFKSVSREFTVVRLTDKSSQSFFFEQRNEDDVYWFAILDK